MLIYDERKIAMAEYGAAIRHHTAIAERYKADMAGIYTFALSNGLMSAAQDQLDRAVSATSWLSRLYLESAVVSHLSGDGKAGDEYARKAYETNPHVQLTDTFKLVVDLHDTACPVPYGIPVRSYVAERSPQEMRELTDLLLKAKETPQEERLAA